jgi:hypothetical protein
MMSGEAAYNTYAQLVLMPEMDQVASRDQVVRGDRERREPARRGAGE